MSIIFDIFDIFDIGDSIEDDIDDIVDSIDDEIDIEDDIEDIGDSIEDDIEDIGDSIEDDIDDIVDSIEDDIDDIGDSIDDDDDDSDDGDDSDDLKTIDLFRFRNTTFSTGTYVFVAEQERDAILDNPELNQTFELDGVQDDDTINPAFTASLEDGDDLAPYYRIRNVAPGTSGTYAFVGQQERDAIFVDPNLRESWVAEGLDENGDDIPEFFLGEAGSGIGTEFNRFQNTENGTFLYAGAAETEAIANDPNLSSLFTNQGVAFESLI